MEGVAESHYKSKIQRSHSLDHQHNQSSMRTESIIPQDYKTSSMLGKWWKFIFVLLPLSKSVVPSIVLH